LNQKSERVQKLITHIMSRLLNIGNSHEIETPSFYMKHLILNVSNKLNLNELCFQNGIFKLPSFCDLVQPNLNCSKINAVIVKVNLTSLYIVIFVNN